MPSTRWRRFQTARLEILATVEQVTLLLSLSANHMHGTFSLGAEEIL